MNKSESIELLAAALVELAKKRFFKLDISASTYEPMEDDNEQI